MKLSNWDFFFFFFFFTIRGMMMMMIHSISSAPFICENHIQRRLAPQIVIINFTFARKGVF